jgi:hypothetical protein
MLEAMEEMASSFTARTISVNSLLVEQIIALDLDPNNASQSLQLMNMWRQKGILFTAMYAPNPNDKRASFWLDFSGDFRPVCLDPAELDKEVRAYWDTCGQAIMTRDARHGGGEYAAAPDFAFVDYTGETVVLPKEHTHLKRIFGPRFRIGKMTQSYQHMNHMLNRCRTQDDRDKYMAKLSDEDRPGVEALQAAYTARKVTTQDALFELMVDIVGASDYPGGKDLYKKPRKGQENQSVGLQDLQRRVRTFNTFVLTIDNVFKMLAVYFRLEAGMPVVIMGETGCGKTYSIQYLATVLAYPFFKLDVHGGLETQDIINFMWYGRSGTNLDPAVDIGPLQLALNEVQHTVDANEAERKKWEGKQRNPFVFEPQPVWVFFDEVNTCDSVGLFREMVCDHSMNGLPLPANLKVIAALNPYRLKQQQGRTTVGIAHKNVDQEVADAKGIAFRDLVYVVHPIPRTMLEYIWDYGTLGPEEETRYMRSMLMQQINKEDNEKAWHLRSLMGTEEMVDIFARYFGKIVQEAHNFLRNAAGGEVSTVSLRDVARCVKLFGWFRKFLHDKNDLRGHLAQDRLDGHALATKAFLLALSHCYYFRLQEASELQAADGTERGAFRDQLQRLSTEFWDAHTNEFATSTYADWVYTGDEYEAWLQDQMTWFIRAMSPLPPGIAANVALTENIFMMIVCITCRIPLIVVGNPGTSKTLAMTIIMEKLNPFTKAPVFDNLNLASVQAFSYQCSRHSTADEIERRFVDAKKAQDKA